MAASSLDRIEQAARISVLRALGFAGLGIATVMVGFCYAPALMCKVGGTLAAIVAAALLLKATTTPNADYRRTETFMLLEGSTGLDPAREGRAILGTLSKLYRRYARYHAYAAVSLLTLSYAV